MTNRQLGALTELRKGVLNIFGTHVQFVQLTTHVHAYSSMLLGRSSVIQKRRPFEYFGSGKKKSNGNDEEDLWKTGAQMSDAFEFCDNVTVLTRIADVCV